MRTTRLTRLAAILFVIARPVLAQTPPPRRVETLNSGDGRSIAGTIQGDPAHGYMFKPASGDTAAPLSGEVIITGSAPAPSTGSSPFQIVFGPSTRLSGRFLGMDARTIRLEAPDLGVLTVPRTAAQSIVQRPGEVQVLRDGFESLELQRWFQIGSPEINAEPRLNGAQSLRLPAGGSSMTTRLPEPLGSGRLELAFFDDGIQTNGQRWYVDLAFRRPNGDTASLRVVLGWSEETLAVETPGGPALNVQPLARKPGWRRLSVRFDEPKVAIAIDGDELARGHGLGGPLIEIRLATETTGAPPPTKLAARVDDLQLVRFVEPFGKAAVDPAQDELRKLTGDQYFGQILSADAEQVLLAIDGTEIRVPWSEVAGLYLRRVASISPPVDGLWVQAEWRTAAGHDPRDLDRAEAVLAALTDDFATLTLPYVGSIRVPRDRLRSLKVVARAQRILIDPTTHHIGDRITADLDPPQAERTPIEIPFELAKLPPGPAVLAVDVVQLVGLEGTNLFSDEVKKGRLRTRSAINGRFLEDWNLKVGPRNDTPQRLRLAIPDGVLQPGRNVLWIEQTGTDDEPMLRDNMGLLGVALEFPAGVTPP